MWADDNARSEGLMRISLSFYNMKVCCVFSLKSPHWGDSNEYIHIQHTVFNIKTKITLNYPKPEAKGLFSKGLENEF